PELRLPQRNFLRAVVLKADSANGSATNRSWSLVVKDQINGWANNSRLVGAAAIRNPSNAVSSLFLFDGEKKVVTLSERNTNGAWRVVRNISLPFTEFNELQPIALGGTRPNAVGFIGLNAIGTLPLFGTT